MTSTDLFHYLQSERRWAISERVVVGVVAFCCTVIVCGLVAAATVLWLVS